MSQETEGTSQEDSDGVWGMLLTRHGPDSTKWRLSETSKGNIRGVVKMKA